MRTYADYLTTKTVKILNTIARDMGLKGYSKLRKAELVTFIDNAIAEIAPVILTVEDNPVEVSDIMAAVFSEAVVAQTPIKPAEKPVQAVSRVEVEETTLEDLKTAYGFLKASWNKATGERARKLMIKLIEIRRQVRAMGFKPVNVGMGYAVG